MPSCYACGKELEVLGRVGRGETCPHCRQDIHCCRNCSFYDPSAYNGCRESVAERVLDKEQANFCEQFEVSGREYVSSDPTVEARRKLEALFKKKK